MTATPLSPLTPMGAPAAPAAAPSTRFTPLDPLRILRQYARLLIVVGLIGLGIGVGTYFLLKRYVPSSPAPPPLSCPAASRSPTLTPTATRALPPRSSGP